MISVKINFFISSYFVLLLVDAAEAVGYLLFFFLFSGHFCITLIGWPN